MDYMPAPIFGGWTEISLENGYLVKREYELKWRGGIGRNALASTRYFHPTEGQWREFWEEMERIRIWEWKKRYSDTDAGGEVYDGGSWHLKMTYRGKTIDTFGVNAGPQTGAPKKSAVDSPWQTRLSEAVSQLIQKPD